MPVRGLALLLSFVCAACARPTASPQKPAAAARPEATPATAPRPTEASVHSGFVAFGDFGGGAAQLEVAKAIGVWKREHAVDAFVTTGDNVYDWNAPDPVARYVEKPYAALRGGAPMWLAVGNHDARYGRSRAELAYFGLPDPPFAKVLPGVQLLFLDANHPDEVQARWLDERLSEPGPTFRVVVFHQPAYSCGPHGSTLLVDRFWVPVIERHRVALVLNGHDHAYQRFTSAGGVTYVVTGGGGRELYPVRTACDGVPASNAAAVKHHFTGVEVRDGTLELTAVAADGSVIDRATLTGTAPG